MAVPDQIPRSMDPIKQQKNKRKHLVTERPKDIAEALS